MSARTSAGSCSARASRELATDRRGRFPARPDPVHRARRPVRRRRARLRPGRQEPARDERRVLHRRRPAPGPAGRAAARPAAGRPVRRARPGRRRRGRHRRDAASWSRTFCAAARRRGPLRGDLREAGRSTVHCEYVWKRTERVDQLPVVGRCRRWSAAPSTATPERLQPARCMRLRLWATTSSADDHRAHRASACSVLVMRWIFKPSHRSGPRPAGRRQRLDRPRAARPSSPPTCRARHALQARAAARRCGDPLVDVAAARRRRWTSWSSAPTSTGPAPASST